MCLNFTMILLYDHRRDCELRTVAFAPECRNKDLKDLILMPLPKLCHQCGLCFSVEKSIPKNSLSVSLDSVLALESQVSLL